ncbi:MAG: histidine kinase [Actinomycetota bacterium]|nr:histidine kinase [Actinomycetota bacterium]
MQKVTRRLRREGWTEIDVAIAVGFAAVAEAELRVSTQNIFAGTRSVAADTVLVLAPVLPLVWRRGHPFAAAVAVACALTVVGAGFHGAVLFFGGLLPFLLALYSASAYARAPFDRIVLGLPVLLIGPMPLYVETFRVPTDYVFATVASVFAWLAGQAVRRWRRQSSQLADALADAERGREAQTRLAVAQERVNIARELHDVIAHSMSVMVLQASVARLEADEHPAASRDAMSVIETTGRRALAEMRRLLGVLRSEDVPEIGPQPGLAALPELLDGFRRAGLGVEVRRVGETRALLAAQDVTAFRIVQEALTNALKHGGPGHATLDLEFRPDQLRLTVTNRIARDRAGVDLSGGHGLVGIRERAALFAGTCRAGRDGEGRFITEVALPVESAS